VIGEWRVTLASRRFYDGLTDDLGSGEVILARIGPANRTASEEIRGEA
jgi:hypothetical protein